MAGKLIMADTAYYLQFLEEIDTLGVEVSDFEATFIQTMLQQRPAYLSEKRIAVIREMAAKYLHTEI